ncbi:hypothetical protein AAZX31_06G168700 [Glycine max]|uniref:Polymerase nucleotidyl transferase domain-containing protein n=2 Tax=Glycine subgen. Soja TaxID=1462606 RepID=K7KVN2_SOYBN|nr:uncharacterized protein LOC100815787 [Glycine max]XP_028237058.1 uncharacterized protein LOC114416401 [Glycine soja]XP_028237059.1 uncharacterized protein LOC114416401 [Glycine soja]KAG4389894.1 hypothetical protein GLYMA_06G176600v4 [Glycine max]KAH1246171.1 Protein HESO1 [Glycine max]KAH1246172.1 Protein HESO1 [Glycine max]KRH54301.1 hypothetical protein GLYMA_06G176600v4 [Glycine max]KRH54302.1 hypothetical protein GLYMA_06G176600v4 [Glycine max]|eukprot:XP_006581899.1 uncharacterized protein LOC100815787 [Glycine max]
MDDKQENLLTLSLPSQLVSIDEELWRMAEDRVQEILWTIEPNVLSEVNRKDVIDYVQRLIKGYYGAKVLPFGSVPLKTYLPDGDVDLTTLIHEDAEEDLAQAICNILKSGDDSEYQVKDIQYIRAQVRLVKCTVKNIAVDISFNQMAGIYTLRFLEQVDQLVGKNHIFKRSIILIKAWCYYDSRLLGGHYGLLSTYAVEILVLYIINRFHSVVRGPLEVLYIFLDYYSSFDWDHNYVSIWGPKSLSSLPEIVETPECDQGEFLLQKEFLTNYKNMCSYPTRASETLTHEFPVKFMNILDPLRNDNNLGRSVSIASLHRLRFAFAYSAQKLKQIFTLPGENMGAALEKFFFSTLERNGKGERADVGVPVAPFGTGRFEEPVLNGDCENYCGGSQYVQLYHNYAMPVIVDSSSLALPDDILASSTQQNWSLFYHGGTDVYIPRHTLYHPTYNLEGGGKSRGTGTYIPDLNYNSYWDMSTKAPRPRRFPSSKHNAFPRSRLKKKQVEEVHSEIDINANSDSRLFEFLNEDFPVLPCNSKAIPPTQAEESTPLEKFHSETDMDGTSRSFEFSNEDFPLLPKVCSETHMDGNSRSFGLSKKDSPLLQSARKTILSGSANLTKQAKSFPFSKVSKLKNIEFGTFKKSQSLTEPSVSTKDEKEDSDISLSKKNCACIFEGGDREERLIS